MQVGNKKLYIYFFFSNTVCLQGWKAVTTLGGGRWCCQPVDCDIREQWVVTLLPSLPVLG